MERLIDTVLAALGKRSFFLISSVFFVSFFFYSCSEKGAIKKKLTSDSMEEKIQALEEIAQKKYYYAIPLLFNALTDDSKMVSSQAAETLCVLISTEEGKKTARQIINPLSDLLDERETYIKSSAKNVLKCIGLPAVDRLIELLSAEKSRLREDVIEILLDIEGIPAEKFLTIAFSDNDMRLQMRMTEFLLKRKSADNTWSNLDPSIYDLIINVFENGNLSQKKLAIKIIEQNKGEKFIPFLYELLKDEAKTIRASATEALIEIGSPAVDFLIDKLLSDDISMGCRAASILGEIQNSEAVLPLITVLGEVTLGKAAQKALIKIGEPSVVPLLEVLKNESETKRTQERAVHILAEIRDERALRPFLEFYLTENKLSERVVRKALLKMGKQSIPALSKSLLYGDKYIRIKIVKLFADMEDAAAVAPLADVIMRKSEVKEIRIEAIRALRNKKSHDVWMILKHLRNDKDEDIRLAAEREYSRLQRSLGKR